MIPSKLPPAVKALAPVVAEKRPPVREIVTKWAADLHASAPKPTERAFCEYMDEHLEELILALGGYGPA